MAKRGAIAGETEMGDEVIKGTSITRTTIPVLPSNHLSRRNLVASFKIPVPGTTLVSAPAGYGKTSFITEVVMNQPRKVIWYNISENRDRQDFNRHLVQAIRNVLPGFAPWFTSENKDYARDVVLKVCNELGQIDEELIMVVDNSRVYEDKDDRFANYLFEILPKNLHIIGIRRATPVHTYSRFSGDSNFAIYGPVDLKFTQSEVHNVLEIHGLNPEDESVLAIAEVAKGWPAAVQMIAHNLTRGRAMEDFEKIMASGNEPLSWLVSEVLSSLTNEERDTLASLSAVKSFNYEIAEVILGNGFKKNELNGFALDGLFFEQANNPERTYTFNKLMGEALFNELHKNPEREKAINSRLSKYFEKVGQPLLAVEHAQSAGEFERVQELFKEAARVLASKGEGQELIRWSKFIGDDSNLGLRLRQTVEVMGLTVDFKYNEAMSLIDEMRFGAKGLPFEDFISKFTNLTEAFVAFAYFRQKDFDRIFKAISEPVISFDISLNERLAAKRLEASIAFLLDDYEGLAKIHKEAFDLGDSDTTSYMKFHLDAIDSMKLYGDGQYQDAYEISSSAIALAKREGFVGITGFVDVMYVQGLCLIEFAQVDDGLRVLSNVQEIAERWSLGPFYFQAVSRITRTLAARGEITEALEMLRGSREYAASFKVSHNFDLFNDLTELSIRAKVGDWDRVRILLERAPEFLLSKQIKVAMEEANSSFRSTEVLQALPENTPRQIIEKCIALARSFIAQESIALGYVRKALDTGAEVQAVETFLRLDVSLLNLVLKAVNEKPTVYLENLATAISTRIRTLSKPTKGMSAPLTKREIEVLRHLSTGKPISAIAGTLHVSQNTMKTHLKNIYRKFEVDGRESAVTKAKELFIL
jgi:LuxR family transcriptional regulator, maltose regulon positive regulatory protein